MRHTGVYRHSCAALTPICTNSNCHAGMHLNGLQEMIMSTEDQAIQEPVACFKDASSAMSERHARSSNLFMFSQAVSKQHDKGEARWDE